jgi:putative transcriptional regulator
LSGSRTTSLARHLLCAVPQLQDPNFKRSVVLMLEHTSDSALGLVVNNPLPNTIAEVAEGLGLHWLGDPEARVRLAGPVEPMRGWIVHDQVGWDPEAHEILPGLQLTTSLDPVNRAGRTAVGGPDVNFLFLLGYAGWGEMQLEGEIAAGSWVAVPIQGGDEEVDPDAGLGVPAQWLFETDPEDMWDEALRSIGVDPGRLVGLKGGDAALH